MPKIEYDRLTLSSFLGGGLEERFAVEQMKVLDNIRDPNTPGDSKRQVIIKLTYRGSDDRSYVDVSAEVDSKLAPYEEIITTAVIEDEDGVAVALQRRAPGRKGADPRQAELPSDVPSVEAHRAKTKTDTTGGGE